MPQQRETLAQKRTAMVDLMASRWQGVKRRTG